MILYYFFLHFFHFINRDGREWLYLTTNRCKFEMVGLKNRCAKIHGRMTGRHELIYLRFTKIDGPIIKFDNFLCCGIFLNFMCVTLYYIQCLIIILIYIVKNHIKGGVKLSFLHIKSSYMGVKVSCHL